MAELNISATDLSNEINISRNALNLCRSGKAKMIKFETIAELCKGLYVQPDYFFKEK
ncbi:helix-turn-helix domain-containing protein [Limosilactobacillus vaginalis]|uniref:helix-turn-helix domain-containing protein n=1 Tax=Limosilactobacillus vaginalis TaxID=1633 RepID=UPI0035D05436